eukprot:3566496-Pleurochrysis_carterae.AAC.1
MLLYASNCRLHDIVDHHLELLRLGNLKEQFVAAGFVKAGDDVHGVATLRDSGHHFAFTSCRNLTSMASLLHAGLRHAALGLEAYFAS